MNLPITHVPLIKPKGAFKPEAPTRKSKTEKPEPGAVSRVYGLGTFGAADEGKRVPVAEYLKSKEPAQ